MFGWLNLTLTEAPFKWFASRSVVYLAVATVVGALALAAFAFGQWLQ